MFFLKRNRANSNQAGFSRTPEVPKSQTSRGSQYYDSQNFSSVESGTSPEYSDSQRQYQRESSWQTSTNTSSQEESGDASQYTESRSLYQRTSQGESGDISQYGDSQSLYQREQGTLPTISENSERSSRQGPSAHATPGSSYAKSGQSSQEVFTDAMSSSASSRMSSLPSDGNIILRDLLGAVNIACVPTEARITSLRNLLSELNDRPLPDYDFELFHGAVNIIYQKLAVALCTNPTDEELRLSCNVIERMHYASAKAVESAYNDVGFESLPLLINVLQITFLENYHVDDGQSRRRAVINRGINIITRDDGQMRIRSGRRASDALKDAVQSVCITLVTYSSIESGKISMACVPGLLLTLVWIMDKFHSMPNAARCAAITVMANLSEIEGNRLVMLKTPRLLDGVKRMTATDENDLIKKNATISLHNLEYSYNHPPNRFSEGPSVNEESSYWSSIGRTSPLPSSANDTYRTDDGLSQGFSQQQSSAFSNQQPESEASSQRIFPGSRERNYGMVTPQPSVNTHDVRQEGHSPPSFAPVGQHPHSGVPSQRLPPDTQEPNYEMLPPLSSNDNHGLGQGEPSPHHSPPVDQQHILSVSSQQFPPRSQERGSGIFSPDSSLNNSELSCQGMPPPPSASLAGQTPECRVPLQQFPRGSQGHSSETHPAQSSGPSKFSSKLLPPTGRIQGHNPFDTDDRNNLVAPPLPPGNQELNSGFCPPQPSFRTRDHNQRVAPQKSLSPADQPPHTRGSSLRFPSGSQSMLSTRSVQFSDDTDQGLVTNADQLSIESLHYEKAVHGGNIKSSFARRFVSKSRPAPSNSESA